jgi:hypothetical protein
LEINLHPLYTSNEPSDTAIPPPDIATLEETTVFVQSKYPLDPVMYMPPPLIALFESTVLSKMLRKPSENIAPPFNSAVLLVKVDDCTRK